MTTTSKLEAKARGRAQAGMTLVEVLVTLVLISVGLLGVAALQLTTLKNNQEAYVRTQASVLAGYILDRMRANQLAATNGQYDVVINGTGAANTTAGRDLAAWQAEIDRLLPGADGDVGGSIQRTDTRVITITIQWGERADRVLDGEAAEATLPTFQTRTEI